MPERSSRQKNFMYFTLINHLNAENPPKSAPLAIPTQNPIVKPDVNKKSLMKCPFNQLKTMSTYHISFYRSS